MDGKHILIAEDEHHLRLVMCLLLRRAGYQVSIAEDGVEAFCKILEYSESNNPVHLVITDIFMPKIDGLELIDWLQAEQLDIPVIAISGYGNNRLLADLRCRGCTEYLDKPFIPEEMLDTIDKVLEA